MLPEQRQQAILRLLDAAGGLTVADLARRLGVTEQTIRRDLSRLEAQGRLMRSHGGAVPVGTPAGDLPFGIRLGEAAAEKQRIAKAAAQLIAPGDTIILDAGTTTLALARAIASLSGIKVVTNSLPIAMELAPRPEIEVVQVGGEVRDTTLSTVGATARETLARFHTAKLFLAARGVDPEHGLSNTNLVEAEIKQAMIAAAGEVYLLAHGAKLGRRYLYTFAPATAVDRLLTDASADPGVVRELQALGVAVTVVE